MVKRIAMFAYGVASYLVSLGTFLYAAGFIGHPRGEGPDSKELVRLFDGPRSAC